MYKRQITDNSGILTPTSTTSAVAKDVDNISTEEEQNAPNNGDGNGDGIADAQQSDVSSYMNPIVDGYVTTQVTGDCNTIDQVSYHVEPELGVSDDQFDYIIGLHGVELSCSTVGGSATITHFWDQEYDISEWNYHKFMNGEYVDFNDQITYGTATIGSNTVTTVSFTLTDGGTFDADGTENGAISDPAGPAVSVQDLSETGTRAWTAIVLGLALIVATTVISRGKSSEMQSDGN